MALDATVLIDAMAGWIASAAGLTAGDDLFVGRGPQDAVDCVIVRETGGPSHAYGPGLAVTLQLTARAADPIDARALAWQCYDALYPAPERYPRRNVDLSATWRAHTIDATQPPQDIGIGEDGMAEYTINLLLKAVRLPAA